MMRLALCSAICVCVLFAGAGPALADDAAITVTTADRQQDPAAGVPRVFTIAGTSSRPKQVYVKYRAPGGAACAPSAFTDTGEVFFGSVYGSSVNRSFSLSQAFTFGSAGPFVFCIWIAASESAITAPITQTIAFRAPTGTIAATVDPRTPQVDQPTTIHVVGASEAPARVYAKFRSASAASCAASFDADPGIGLLSGDRVNGAFTLTTTARRGVPGSYQLCLWLAMSSSDPFPIAAAQARAFNVLTPVPALPVASCIVPRVTRNIRVSTMKARLRRANCAVGKVRYLRSSKVPRRAVVRLNLRSGRRLQPGTRVTIYVSTGRTPRTPGITTEAR